MRRLLLLAAIGAVLISALPQSGYAARNCEFGCEPKTFLLARGVSPLGVHWRIDGNVQKRIGEQPRAVTLEFDFPDYPGSGYLSTFPARLPKRFGFSADGGNASDSIPEQDVSGFTSRRVQTIRILMADGQTLETQPVLPAAKARRQHKEFRRFRVFDVFFSANQEPVRVLALDRGRRVIAKKKSDQGSFF